MARKLGVLAAAFAGAILIVQPAWAIKWLVQTKGEPLIQQEGSPERTIQLGYTKDEVVRILGAAQASEARSAYYTKLGLKVVYSAKQTVSRLEILAVPSPEVVPAEVATDRGLTTSATVRDAARIYSPYKRVDSRTGISVLFHYWGMDNAVAFYYKDGRLVQAKLGSASEFRKTEAGQRAYLKKHNLVLTPEPTPSADAAGVVAVPPPPGKRKAKPVPPPSIASLEDLGVGMTASERGLIAQTFRARTEMELGMRDRDRQRYASAARHFKTVLSLKPGNCEARKAYAQALGILGRDREAVGAFRSALQCTTRDADLWFGLGISLAQTGQRKELMNIAAHIGALRPALAKEFRQIAHLGDDDYVLYLREGQ